VPPGPPCSYSESTTYFSSKPTSNLRPASYTRSKTRSSSCTFLVPNAPHHPIQLRLSIGERSDASSPRMQTPIAFGESGSSYLYSRGIQGMPRFARHISPLRGLAAAQIVFYRHPTPPGLVRLYWLVPDVSTRSVDCRTSRHTLRTRSPSGTDPRCNRTPSPLSPSS
jgi:hypothetical protein